MSRKRVEVSDLNANSTIMSNATGRTKQSCETFLSDIYASEGAWQYSDSELATSRRYIYMILIPTNYLTWKKLLESPFDRVAAIAYTLTDLSGEGSQHNDEQEAARRQRRDSRQIPARNQPVHPSWPRQATSRQRQISRVIWSEKQRDTVHILTVDIFPQQHGPSCAEVSSRSWCTCKSNGAGRQPE